MNKRKTASFLSGFFMGLGQFYKREWLKGIAFASVELFVIMNILNGTIFKGLWGIITLGEVKGVKGDHSINLLIDGILLIALLILFLLIYILNVMDAYKVKTITKNSYETSQLKESGESKYFPYILLTPSIVLLFLFVLVPIIFTVLIAFTNFSSPNHLPPGNLVDWVGFKNFGNLFQLVGWKETFVSVFIWTVIWASLTTFINYFGGLLIAVLINSSYVKLKGFWRTIYILPYAVPAFISLLVFRLFLSGPGPVNSFLVNVGITTDKIPFLTDPIIAKITVVLVSLWISAPYWMALMTGVLSNIDTTYYEAAEIDGASKWHQFLKITVPVLLYQTAPLLIMTFAHNFNNFGMIYLLTNGNPQNPGLKQAGSTDILISWIYKMTLEKQWYGMATAVSIIIFIIVAGVSLFSFIKTKSFKEEDML